MKSLLQQTRGIVMMEFLMAMVPLMLAFLAAVQFAFLATAKLALLHSANTAARAAAVVIEDSVDLPGTPDDLYGGLAAGLLERETTDAAAGGPSDQGKLESLAGSSPEGDAGSQLESMFSVLERDGSRLNQIRTAAYIPMLAISPNAVGDWLSFMVSPGADMTSVWAKDDTVATTIGESGVTRLVGAFVYNLGALAVTFPEPESEQEGATQGAGVAPEALTGEDAVMGTREFMPGDEVNVRVTYLFRCRVPLISALICHSGWAILTESAFVDPVTLWENRDLGDPPESYEELDAWRERLDQAKARLDERQGQIDKITEMAADWKQVEVPLVQDILLFRPGARYLVLRAEASLPIQGARYYPRGTEGSS